MKKRIKFSVIFNRKNKLTKEGEGLIQIEAYHERTRRFISTGLHVKPALWNSKQNTVSRKHPNFSRINLTIKKIIQDLEDKQDRMFLNNDEISLDKFFSIKDTKLNFWDLLQEYVDNKNVSKSRRSLYARLPVVLKEFDKTISFESFNYEKIIKFDSFLENEKKNHVNTRAGYHKAIKAFFNHLKKIELLEKNPYDSYKIKSEKTRKEALLEEQVLMIEKLQSNEALTEHLHILIDMFLFSCYTGLRFEDMQEVKNKQFVFNDDKAYLTFKALKTRKYQSNIPLHSLFNGKAIPIVKKYMTTSDANTFPEMSNVEANRNLKIIKAIVGIKKNLTYHMSRHTFGSILAKKTNDPFLIQKLMGHADIKTSMTYIHLHNKDIEDKLDNIEW